MSTEPSDLIIFERAAMTGVRANNKNGTVVTKVEFTTGFDTALANQLGVRWTFFDREALPKEGFKSVEMEYELRNIDLTLSVPQLEEFKLQLTSELAHKFKVVRIGTKKKKGAAMRLKFEVSHAGSPFGILEYLVKIGGAEGRMEIRKLMEQPDLFPPKPKRGRPAKVARRRAEYAVRAGLESAATEPVQ